MAQFQREKVKLWREGFVKQVLTGWKVLWESTNPRESVFVVNTWQHLPHLLFCGPLVPNFPTELFCKQSPVYGVFWPLLPHPSTDRNETRTWSSLSLQEPSHKIWCKSVHTLFSYRGHRQTTTPVNTYSLAFAVIIRDWKSEGVMDEESGESKEEVIGAGIGESEIDKLVWGWRRDTGTWFQRQGEA